MEEVWKDISGYEGRYQISNMGRVKSLPRIIKNIPDKSIDCIYTDIPYLYSSGYHKHQNNCNVGIKQEFVDSLQDIINGIDYSIYDEFVRISKKGNIFIWLSKEQILDTLNYFSTLATNTTIVIRNIVYKSVKFSIVHFSNVL